MSFSNRSVARSQNELPVENSLPRYVWSAWQTVFWSPLLLITGLVQVLCQPLTRRFLLGVVLIDIPLQCGTHLGILPNAPSLGELEGFNFSITTIALCALYIGWLFTERAANQRPRILWNWPIAAYTAVVIASVFVASNPELSFFQIYLMLELFLLYIYFAGTIDSRSDIFFILLMLIVGGMAESIYTLVIGAIGHEFAFIRALGIKTLVVLPTRPGEFTRAGGSIGDPNYAAAYYGMLIALALSIRQMKVPAYLRRLTIPSIILGTLALVATFSRGGWFEAVLSIMVLAGAKWLRDGVSRKALVTAIAALALMLLCLYIPNPISSRLFANDNGAAYSRIPLMHLAGRVIAANPILGVGANNFAEVMGNYAGSEFRHEWIYTVHNGFLLVCSETGVLGLAAYLWIYFSIIRRGWRIWKTRDKEFAPLALGIVAGIVGLLSHMLVESFPYGGLLQLIWLFIALIGICEIIQRRELGDSVSLQTTAARAQ